MDRQLLLTFLGDAGSCAPALASGKVASRIEIDTSAPAFAAAQAVGAVEDTAAAVASWTPKPGTPTTELRGSEYEWDEQLFKLALTMPDERYAARLGEHSQLIETLGRIPSHTGYPRAVARGQHAPASKISEVNRSIFRPCGCCSCGDAPSSNSRNVMGI